MSGKSPLFRQRLLQRLRDPGYAIDYLRAACDDGETADEKVKLFCVALRDVAEAHGLFGERPSAGIQSG